MIIVKYLHNHILLFAQNLKKKGQIIGANDLLIASHALGIGAILVTNNIINPIKDELKTVEKEVDIKKVLNSILNNLMVDNKPYISIGEVGKVMKSDYSNIKYASLKKLIEEYPKDFIIINNNYVKKY